MNGNEKNSDVYDRFIDEALRLAGTGKPPAGYLSRLHRRIEAAPEANPMRGGIRRWAPAAGVVAAAILLAFLLPGYWAKSKPAAIAAVPARTSVPRLAIPRNDLLGSTNGGLASSAEVHVRRIRTHPRKSRHVATRDAANLFNYPLTHQEKLLLQFVRTASPADLQMLDPEYQAKIEAQQEAKFTAYLKSGDDSSTQETAN